MDFFHQFTLHALQHHEGDDYVTFVTDGKMVAPNADLREPGAQRIVELQHWFAETVMGDADALKTDRVAHAAAGRFGKRFLGGKALGEQTRDIMAGLGFRPLVVAPHARCAMFSVTGP